MARRSNEDKNATIYSMADFRHLRSSVPKPEGGSKPSLLAKIGRVPKYLELALRNNPRRREELLSRTVQQDEVVGKKIVFSGILIGSLALLAHDVTQAFAEETSPAQTPSTVIAEAQQCAKNPEDLDMTIGSTIIEKPDGIFCVVSGVEVLPVPEPAEPQEVQADFTG